MCLKWDFCRRNTPSFLRPAHSGKAEERGDRLVLTEARNEKDVQKTECRMLPGNYILKQHTKKLQLSPFTLLLVPKQSLTVCITQRNS